MAAPLKVFTWSDGFHRWTVAATSRAKALGVWGFSRDLFKTGDAQQITSGEDYDEALAHPEVSVERGLSIDPGKVKLRAPAKARAPAADKRERERMAALQAELDALTREQEAASAEIDRRRRALDAEAAKAKGQFDRRREALEAKLSESRRKLG